MSRGAFVRWFVIGAVVAMILVYTGAQSSGGLAGLLRVGEDSVVRDLVESELGTVPLAHGAGHDGQFFYAIGIDLTGQQMTKAAENWAYRYRRILYPGVSSLFGLLDGYALLSAMIAVNIVSMGVAAGSVAAAAASLGSSEWLALTVVLNPGVWLSVSLLTSDISGLALMTLGLVLFLAGRKRGSLVAFVLSVFAKETFLVTPTGLAVSRDRTRWRYFWVPAASLVCWLAITQLTIGSGFATRGNLGLPLMGLVEAASSWGAHEPIDWLYTGFTIVAVLVGSVVAVMRRTWLRWSLVGWCALALISSQLVWEFGNNAARALLAIPILTGLALVSPQTGQAMPSPRPAP